MDIRAKIIAELAAHHVGVGADGTVTVYESGGPEQMSRDDAARIFRFRAAEAARQANEMLSELSSLSVGGHYASGDVTRRMFISAVKHFAKTTHGVTQKVASGWLLKDSSEFSQWVMSRVVEYRLATDWLTHLSSFNRYRAELLEHLPEAAEDMSKTAQAMGRDFSYPEEQSIPWEQYRDRLIKHRAEHSDPASDKSLMERDNELRSEQGLEDYDAAKAGLMFYVYEQNQKIVDHQSGEFGMHAWDDEDDKGPADATSRILGR